MNVTCTYCNAQMPEHSPKCPNCGAPNPAQSSKKSPPPKKNIRTLAHSRACPGCGRPLQSVTSIVIQGNMIDFCHFSGCVIENPEKGITMTKDGNTHYCALCDKVFQNHALPCINGVSICPNHSELTPTSTL